MEYVPAAKASQLAEGSFSAVDVKGKHLLLARVEGEVYALSGTCTHEDADLGLGFLIEDRIVCPLHLSQFDVRQGTAVNPPATLPLQRFNVKIADDTILVEV